MTSLDSYRQRLGVRDDTARDRWLKNTQAWINKKLPRSLSYHTVKIDGEERKCAVLSTQNDDEKKICSMPGEFLECGAYVEYMGFFWLITQVNAPNEVYQTAYMTQCNYNLRWINDRGEIVSRWVSVVDGTKYLTGEFYQGTVTVGDSRLQLTMPRDEETVVLNRGFRFLIDDPHATEPQAYEITKINRTGKVFNGRGVFVHMLSECNRNEKTDNFELMIADYYTKLAKFEIRIDNTDGAIAIQSGESFQINADVLRNKEPIDNAEISYFSSDDNIATVSNDGLVEAVSTGECTITLMYHEVNSMIQVDVVAVPEQEPPHFVIDCPVDGISVGSSLSIPLTFYVDGNETPCDDILISVDTPESVATASYSDGVITVTASRNRRNIGTVVTLTVRSDTYNASSSIQLTVRGWA